LNDVLFVITFDTIKVRLAELGSKVDGTSELARSIPIQNLISSRSLLLLRKSAATLCINAAAEHDSDHGTTAYSAKILESLFSSLPNLEKVHIELGAQKLAYNQAVAFLHQVDRISKSRHLERNLVLSHVDDDKQVFEDLSYLHSLDIQGNMYTTNYFWVAMALPKLLQNCPTLSKLAIKLRTAEGPSFKEIMEDWPEGIQLGIERLELADTMFRGGDYDEYQPIEPDYFRPFKHLRELRIIRQGSGDYYPWVPLLETDIHLRSITEMCIGSSFFDYLSSEQIGQSLKYLHIESDHLLWRDNIARMAMPDANIFWCTVLPNISQKLVELTLFAVNRNKILPALADYRAETLKGLLPWSLSNYNSRLSLPNIKKLSTYAIIELEPNTATVEGTHKALSDEEIKPQKFKATMELFKYCPKLRSLHLFVMLTSENSSDRDIVLDFLDEVNQFEAGSEEIKRGSELIINIISVIEPGVASDLKEYFWGHNKKWNQKILVTAEE